MHVALLGIHAQAYDATLLRSLLLRAGAAFNMLLESLENTAE